MIISNFKNLARNPLRKKALSIAEAGYEAIDIEKVIGKEIKLDKKTLSIKGQKLDLDGFSKIFLIGIGKGSALACVSLARILGKRLTNGIALDIQKPTFNFPLSTFNFLIGTHPLTSKQNINATKKIIELAKGANENDLIIIFICGGGSALLCGSEEELKNSVLATKELTRAGADIIELNTVRKHLSEIKAGNLAKMAYPATVISLIVSDVLGNDLSMVASGPTVYDKTTKIDAERVVKKYLYKSVSQPVLIRNLKETPKQKDYFKKVKNILFLSNREPILAMEKKAEKMGFKPKIYSLKIKGEAKNSLLVLMEVVRAGEAVLAAGETTVTMNSELRIKNYGKGGRNMEAALGVLNSIHNSLFIIHNSVILSFASDGRDNTEAAGAIGDILSIKKAEKMKLNLQDYLVRHDSFNFFKKTDDLIFSQKKSFNVSDLMIVLKEIQ